MTARRTSDLEKLRRFAYFLSRSIGDAQAAQRGPEVLGKRIARRQVRRAVGRRTGGWL
jgi:hypothetical protein